ncbi:uncharacterized protein [Linepithema humile]|uniref:uncharacterized protein n=1 Tax=Linepithema humile TaxID=83485 RepID=UPI00351EEE54
MAVSMKQLTQARGQIKAHITRFRTFLDGFSPEHSIVALETRLEKIEPFYERYDEVQSQIETAAQTEEEVETARNERDQFETSYFKLVTRAKTILRPERVPARNDRAIIQDEVNVHNVPQIGVKLPVIKLPVFDGSHDRWIKFRDTFQLMIDDNPTLTDIQKFHYLDSAITGDAERAIEALGISAANYQTAWKTLKERFEDHKALSHYHVRGLFELSAMTRDSLTSLRQLIDQTTNHLLALKNLGEAVDSWDSMIVYLLSTKLDAYTKREWDKRALQLNEKPTFKEIIEFLNSHCKYLERQEVNKQDPTIKGKGNPSAIKTSKFKTNNISSHVTQRVSCPICKNAHNIYHCEEFVKLPIPSRISEVQKHKLCFNCLRSDHQNKDCTSGHCRKCSRKHNTLLHRDEASQETDPKIQVNKNTASDSKEDVKGVACHHTQRRDIPVMLATAIISVQDSQGNLQDCRVLLDGGSQSHFITQKFCERLNLNLVPINQPVSGLGSQQINLSKKTEIIFKSKYNAYGARITCLVIQNITEDMPNVSVDAFTLKIPKNLTLADPLFHQSRPIDLLIGAEHFWDLLCIGQIPLGPFLPIMQKTKFGWIIGGPMASSLKKDRARKCCHVVTTQQLHDQIARFWQLEECNPSIKGSVEDTICEDYFCSTTTRNEEGRFVVSIPFRENLQALGQSKERAFRRLLAIERKLKGDISLSFEYRSFMSDYETSGHMSQVPMIQFNEKIAYYLPHHAVRKEDSTTTKVRVVFDGSAKTTSGLSINDVQYVGPVVQDDLFSILLRFRKHKFVISADIKQMYRQVLVRSDQRNYQQILWRKDDSTEVQEYQLNTITYGMASAPFLATRCLQQIAQEHAKDYPIASRIIARDFYMDDLLSGAESIQEAQELKQVLSELLIDYGFELRKWASNNKHIVQSKPEESFSIFLHEGKIPKILGLSWNSEKDILNFSLNTSRPDRITKRTILSIIACIFDPLGLIVPIVVTAKLILQQLWQLQLDWDEALPQDMYTTWDRFHRQLELLHQIKVPRRVYRKATDMIQLHGFSDASEKAYGASIYVRVPNTEGSFEVSLLCAKSRVAPLKPITLPRLELCGALLLARLMQRVSAALNIDKKHHYFWCDSTIVLCYIAAEPKRWTTFVANRTAEIQEITNKNWRHVPTTQNPADLTSRGMDTSALSTSTLWWHGPSWLSKSESAWPDPVKLVTTNIPDTRSKLVISLALTNIAEEFGHRFSSFSHMI